MTGTRPTASDDAVITAIRLVQARRSADAQQQFGLQWTDVLALASLVIAALMHAAQLDGVDGPEAQEAWADAWLADALEKFTLYALAGQDG